MAPNALVGKKLANLNATSSTEKRYDNEEKYPVNSALPNKSEKKQIEKLPEPEIKEEKKADASKNSQAAIDKAVVDKEKEELVSSIVDAASSSSSSDDAIDKLESERVAKLIASIAAEEDDTAKINKARSTRMDNVKEEFYKKTINGRTVRQMITEPDEEKINIECEIPKTSLEISSINEEWKNLTYTNFDKEYDVNEDIVKVLNAMSEWSYPIVIRDLSVENTSTALDYVNTWTVQCEDSFGKRFTLKFDVPIFMNENRYMMLRGNRKTIETQFFLMPILKTDEGDAQIVSNYNKIFVRRYNTMPGKSNSSTDEIVRGLKKYKGTKIKVSYGDNTKICSKYALPISYIDLAKIYSKIDIGDTIYYFNQDEIRERYDVDNSRGIPFGVRKNNKDSSKWDVMYYNGADDIAYNILWGMKGVDKDEDNLENEEIESEDEIIINDEYFQREQSILTQEPVYLIQIFH